MTKMTISWLAAVSMLLIFSCDSAPTHIKIDSDITLNEIELVPEGIAYSSNEHTLYLTSVALRKIIAVDLSTGEQRDFISEAQYEYPPGVGILANDDTNELYALGGFWPTPDTQTGLYIFDLSSGQLKNKVNVTREGEYFFNDLIDDNQGNLYITDTKASMVWKYNDIDGLSSFYESEEIASPNGIAIDDDHRLLYVASYLKGVRIIDIHSKQVLNESDTSGASNGIDGLEFYKGDLYGIQNAVAGVGFSFRQLHLNEAGDAIEGVTILEDDQYKLDVPLTFCLVNDQAVIIGNSNLEHLDQATLKFPNPDSLRRTELIIHNLP